MGEIESQRGVELHGARHIVGRQGDRADVLDHRDDAVSECRPRETEP
jgi:hypothetical protein